MRYSPDELKAIVLHHGSYRKAAKAIKIGVASLIDAATADYRNVAYKLSDANYDKVYQHLKSLDAKAKKNVKDYEGLLDAAADHPSVKRAYMNARHKDREKGLEEYLINGKRTTKKRLTQKDLWSKKIMAKLYDKYQWQKGHWKR